MVRYQRFIFAGQRFSGGGGILFVFNSSLYEIRNRTSYKNKYQVLNIIESTLGVKAKELDYSELFTDKEKITGM